MSKTATKKQNHVGVIGIPFSKGQPRGGTEHGPVMMRDFGILDRIRDLGNKVTDYGDLSLEMVEEDKPWNTVKNPRTVGSANKKVSDSVQKITKDRQIALTLGGDHSIAIGSIHGHAQSCPDLVVVWVDAHADINTPLSSESGNIHGMPLSFVVKEMQKYTPRLPGFDWCTPCLSAKDLVYIGLRDVEEAERAYMSECGIASYSMQEVDRYGLPAMMERVLKTLDPFDKRPIHVSFDVDAMDPETAPSTGTPVHGGLTRREMYYIAEEIAATGNTNTVTLDDSILVGQDYQSVMCMGRLSGLDVVEVNPSLGSEADRKKTVRTTVDVVSHFFGKRREGNVSAGFKIPLPAEK